MDTAQQVPHGIHQRGDTALQIRTGPFDDFSLAISIDSLVNINFSINKTVD